MAFTPGNSNGALNGTTPVDVVAAPASSTQRLVRKVRFFNLDTASVTITLQLDDNSTDRVLQKFTLAAGEAGVYEDVEVLDATTKKLQALMSGAPATTQPAYSAAWADKT
jgi:hypothetical protein